MCYRRLHVMHALLCPFYFAAFQALHEITQMHRGSNGDSGCSHASHERTRRCMLSWLAVCCLQTWMLLSLLIMRTYPHHITWDVDVRELTDLASVFGPCETAYFCSFADRACSSTFWFVRNVGMRELADRVCLSLTLTTRTCFTELIVDTY